MITLKDYLEAVGYRITGGSEYQWKCFGENARYLDCDSPELNVYNVSCVFDSVDQTVYTVEAWDYANERVYRWIHPAYIKKHMKACAKHEVDVYSACDSMNYTDLDVAEDILEKASAIIKGEEYDERVLVPLTIDKDEMFELMRIAHSKDITLNELVEDILRSAIDLAEESKRNYCED